MKKGISLIVLVITIIVMIILAASVVISLTSTGVIDKAGQAVNLSDEKQVQNLAATLWSEAYLAGDRDATLVQNVTTKLSNEGVTATDWNIEISNTGIAVTSKKVIRLITFTLVGETLQAEENMTWVTYVASKYNTKNLALFEDISIINNGGYEVLYNGSAVSQTGKILANGVYTFSNAAVPD